MPTFEIGPYGGVERATTTITPAAASTTAVHASFAGNDASNDFPGAFSNPDTPRVITATFAAGWDGGNIGLTGTGENGAALTETITASAGNTVSGTKLFRTVTAATKGAVGASADGCSLGTGSTIGTYDFLTAATATEYVCLCANTNGAFTWELPAASLFSSTKRALTFKKSDSGANAVTLDGNGSETIDGSATATITSAQATLTIVANSTTTWVVI